MVTERAVVDKVNKPRRALDIFETSNTDLSPDTSQFVTTERVSEK